MQNILHYTIIDNNDKTWARVSFIRSTASKGTPEEDFKSEWNEFAVNQYKVDPNPIGTDTQNFKGWKTKTSLCKFMFNSDTVSMLVNTFSNGHRCITMLIQSNTTKYGPILDEFIGSVELPPAVNHVNTNNSLVNTENTPPAGDGFTFGITNFDDGWTSVAREDWVEATKGNIKVLLHYPRKEDKEYYSQYDERVRVFWNLLVAPRYSNLRNFETPGYNMSFEPGYYAAGLLKDNASGKDVWVTLFSKAKTGWLEIISPDKESFIKTFGISNVDTQFDNWQSLLNLAGLNRFAVGEKDLSGKWSNEFQASNSYYNVYTGLYTGSTTHASRENFEFQQNKTYKWDIVMANGATGTLMKVDKATANGSWKLLSNWQIWCSDIERKPKTYNAYFSCFKGGRILWLQDTEYGSYTAYGKISN